MKEGREGARVSKEEVRQRRDLGRKWTGWGS